MRIVYFDCFSGISGDMALGALVDAGIDGASLSRQIASLQVGAELVVERVKKGGFAATQVRVVAPAEHAHRHLKDIVAIIDRSDLSQPQKNLAVRIFQKLAEAEAAAHGSTVERVHFHEAGAVDSIVDIVGTAVGIDLLAADRIVASPVPTGSGTVLCAHGRLPVPAPGTAELLKGIPLVASEIQAELTTPTGAAILASVVDEFGPLPAMSMSRIGYGAGQRDLDEQPNILRLIVGEATEPAGADWVWVAETNLDDVPAEFIGHCMDRLFQAGALDVYTTSVGMKKCRPGVMLSVICNQADLGALETIIFQETATLGIRKHRVIRSKLERKVWRVNTQFGAVVGKVAIQGAELISFAPEFDSCRQVAAKVAVPLREVYRAAIQAFDASQAGQNLIPAQGIRAEPKP